MKYLIFGTGDYYERYKKWFSREDVLALLDNSPVKQNTYIDGIKVLSPESGVYLAYDAIVILSFYVKAMKRQLTELGVPEQKIYHFYDLHKLIKKEKLNRPVQYFGSAEGFFHDNGKPGKVLLLSHDLTLGGPAIALFHAAWTLKNHGYGVLCASMLDGPLRRQAEERDIPVLVDENMQIGTMKDCRWISGFSFIICNTVNFHVFLSDRDTDVPVIWWLHDSRFFYDGVDRQLLERTDKRNLHVVSVGPVPRQAVRDFLPDLEVGRLNYCVSDVCGNHWKIPHKNSRVCFVTIGYIEERKGQDILIEAVRRMSESDREKAEFFLVGQDSSLMAQRLKQETKDCGYITYTGTVGRKEIDMLLEKADVLICPSREDPMPTVAAEAMMHGVPCILSDAAGTAEYVHDGVDGFIFHSQDAAELSERISWCVKHRGRLHDMGKLARKIYVSVFSEEVFENGLMELVGICET